MSTRAKHWLAVLVSLGVFVAAWEWYGQQAKVFAVVPPSKVIPTLVTLLGSAELLNATLGTLLDTALGYVIAVIIGVSVGVLIALSKPTSYVLTPVINALNGAPMSALIPLVGVYIGFGVSGRVFIVALWSVFVILLNTSAGIQAVPRALIEMADSFTASRWQKLTTLWLPAAFPSILGGLRLGLGRAFRGAIAAEMILSVSHLGKMIKSANATFNMPQLFARTLFIIIIGLVMVLVAEIVERRLLKRWGQAS